MLEPWNVDERDFPRDGVTAAKLRFAVRYAVLAPSCHNSQPWRFQTSGPRIELLADRNRSLPVADPHDRELTISCGAALFNLRLALFHFGYEPVVEVQPRTDTPNLLARISLGPDTEPTPEEERMFAEITRRRTHRGAFEDRVIPDSLGAPWPRAATAEGGAFRVVEGTDRKRVIDLVAEGDRRQGADPQYRREMAGWLRNNWSQKDDGLVMSTFGSGNWASLIGPRMVRAVDWGAKQAELNRRLLEGSPMIALIATDQDNVGAWLRAGQTLGRILMLARAEGIYASFVNQPLQVPALRREVESLLPGAIAPQMLLRLGFGKDVPPTPRRSAESVITEDPLEALNARAELADDADAAVGTS